MTISNQDIYNKINKIHTDLCDEIDQYETMYDRNRSPIIREDIGKSIYRKHVTLLILSKTLEKLLNLDDVIG